MAKKTTKDTEHKDEELDEHDEARGADEDSDEDEEEARPAVAAKADRSRRAKVRAVEVDHEDDHGHGHDDDADESGTDDEEDPYWWAPHAVMSTLVLVGVLGFFGVFNKVLAPIAAHPKDE